jgi:type II secretory pathway component PulK
MNHTDATLSRWVRCKRFLLTPVGTRIPVRRGRGAPHGIALLTVMLALALMGSVVTDLSTNEIVRFRLAAHDRDAMKAGFLAESGLQVARLVLSMQSAVQPCIAQLGNFGIPLPAHTFWQLIPMDSEILKGITSGELQSAIGLDVSAAVAARQAEREEQLAALQAEFDADADGVGKAPFQAPEGGFGRFEGDFKAEVIDEEQKAVSLRGWATATTPQQRYPYVQRLLNIIQPRRYDWLFDERDAQGNRVSRCEFVAGMFDWADDNTDATDGCADITSWGRNTIGNEDGQFGFKSKVRPKNAYYDSQAELRLAYGMNEGLMRAFGDQISIYGEGKINLLSAPDSSIEALIFACAQPGEPRLQDEAWIKETIVAWREGTAVGPMLGGMAVTAEGFIGLLDARGMTTAATCKDSISLESRNFTVKAHATVGDVQRTVTAVMRFYSSSEELYYFSNQM